MSANSPLANGGLVAVNEDQQAHSQNQYNRGNPKLNVRQDGPQGVCPATAFILHGTSSSNSRINVTDYDKLRYWRNRAAVKRNL
jgi:hypothetical protein